MFCFLYLCISFFFYYYFACIFFFFFFQAEDGIRDHCVTGVQTCAIPIWVDGQYHCFESFLCKRNSDRGSEGSFSDSAWSTNENKFLIIESGAHVCSMKLAVASTVSRRRSEERRVGKECRSGWRAYDLKKE